MKAYHQGGNVTLYHGHAGQVLADLPAGSVDCIVTSPPYFGMRDYGMAGQVGLEGAPGEYVHNLQAIFTEARRVLTDDGTLWLNLGDAFDRKKNLRGMPWRVAFALQDDGWTLRADIIWSKRNFLPEGSVKDRPTRSHEYVFLFTKGRKYWYDAEAIREESDPKQREHNVRYAKEYADHTARAASTGQPGNVNNVGIHSRPGRDGRNARSIWSISANPFPGAHFAVMPRGLAERCIIAGCRPGGTVLDPFSGSGTTGMMALRNGRKYVGIDINSEYLDLSLTTRFAERSA